MPDKKTIYLIHPASGITFSGLSECMDLFGRRAMCPNLALPTLAALVDEESFRVILCDENVEAVDFDLGCDIVGLTACHNQKERAFDIGRAFKERGKLVVMGGVVATLTLPDTHPLIDVIFRGEAERTWPQFLRDYLQGRHRPIYREDCFLDMALSPTPRLDLLPGDRYLMGTIQISRGCPFRCEYCSSIVLAGQAMRYKSSGQVTAELEQLHRLGYRDIFVADDNFTADRRRVKEILELLRDWNRAHDEPLTFSANISIDFARQQKLVPLLAEALVLNVFVGIESPNRDSLVETGKLQNLKGDMLQHIEGLHRRGIDVSAGMIVGFDHDNRDIFQLHADFLKKAHIPVCFVGMLLAPDGTPLKKRLLQEGRYLGSEIVGNHSSESNIIPKQMGAEELRNGYFWLMNRLYGEQHFIQRIKEVLPLYPKARVRRSRSKLRLFPVLTRLVVYYMREGKTMRQMFRQFFSLILKYRHHRELIVYWMIAYKHFRQTLIRHGVWKQHFVPPRQYGAQ
jgi:tRNA A37 methylthiotransferase MiaB